jgi:uncharacterized membrane-anchored protein YitT (DUF2179 family)
MHSSTHKSFSSLLLTYAIMAVGAFITAFAIVVFLFPNKLIDGGTMGIAMILSNLFGEHLLPIFATLLLLPFIYLAYRAIGQTFVVQTLFALGVFSLSTFILHEHFTSPFVGSEKLEVVVIGGSLLGLGIGLIIRYGGCLDGTEILGILINKSTGFTVGQVVLACNVFIFAACGIVFRDWHPPLLSLITYMVASKVMDAVIVGLDETKSVLIISQKSRAISEAIMHELGLGLTIMYGRGGFSGEENEILYVIAERLQLAELKDIIYREDPSAFIAIENLHEVANGNQGYRPKKKKTKVEMIFSRLRDQTSK